MLFWPPASVQTMCVSLGSQKNRTWGKGLCARTLFRSMVPGSRSKKAGNGGGRVNTRVLSQRSHWTLDVLVSTFQDATQTTATQERLLEEGSGKEVSVGPCLPLVKVWPHWVLTPLHIHAVYAPRETHSILCLNSNRGRKQEQQQ